MSQLLYTADVVYNGVGLPLEQGGVIVSRVGMEETVVSFGKAAALRMQFPDALESRLGRAIMPRAVNAHTHLDLTDFTFAKASYPNWMTGLVGQMVGNRELRGVIAARRGLELMRTSGAMAFGDIVAIPEVMDMLLLESDLPGVAYWEVFEAKVEQADQFFLQTVERIRAWRKLERPGGMRVGLSPHTPMTVSNPLMKRLIEFARLEGLPLQIHAAESPQELELFRTGTGPLANVYSAWQMPPLERIIGRAPSPDLTPIKYLAEIGALEAKPTLIHAVNVFEEDVRIVAQFGCPVVTCPRSNANLECGVFPWALYARYGIEVGLGTDSIASGQTLNIFDEASSAVDLLKVDLRQVVRWMVKGGHRALGLKPPMVQRGDAFSSLKIWAD